MSDSLEGVYAPLTPEQTATATAFLDAIQGIEAPQSYKDFMSHHPLLFATKWLVARKWVLKNAVEMYTEAAAWRIAEGFETKPLFPSCVSVKGWDIDDLAAHQGQGVRPTNQFIDKATAITNSCYAAGWHKWDKQGRPVYIERSGKTKTHLLVQRLHAAAAPGEPIAPFVVEPHKHSNEVGAQVLKAQQRKLKAEGKFVCQATVIMDCSGMSLSQMRGPAMDLLKANSQMDQKYVPEGMYRAYLINCPSFIRIGWAIVKLWLDAESQKKVIFCMPGEATRKVLADNFNEEDLPEFLGGKCRCEGGCVPDVDDSPEPASDGPQTVELNVKAMTIATYDVPVTTGTKVQWQFATVANDINFSVSFVPSEEGAKPIVMIPAAKTAKSGPPESCVVVAPSDGAFVFTFDNYFSWMSSKTIRLRVTVEAPAS